MQTADNINFMRKNLEFSSKLSQTISTIKISINFQCTVLFVFFNVFFTQFSHFCLNCYLCLTILKICFDSYLLLTANLTPSFLFLAPAVSKIEPIVENGLATTEGMAVDWIANNIYWVESSLDQIEVAKLDGSSRATLIAGNISNPRAIVLDPRVGQHFLFEYSELLFFLEIAAII